jgi:tRNA1Val (adenine37-N6)-methyltransferase
MRVKTSQPEAVDRCELFGGRLTLAQPREGYRFSLDSILLAWWTDFEADDRVLDAGCGVGVVGLALARCRGARDVTGVELQPDLAALARANVSANGASAWVSVVEADLRQLPPMFGNRFDVVCANPPFYEEGAGRLNPSAGKAAARHELTLTVDDLALAAAFTLKKRGRFYFVHQPRRLAEVFSALGDQGFNVERLRFVQPRDGEAANLVLVGARLGGARETVVMRPLVVYEGPDEYGAEVAAIYGGRGRPLYGPRAEL